MLNISQLNDRVTARFHNCELLTESVLYFARIDGDIPYAACYLDIGQRLPDSEDVLTRYQDELLGDRYFQGRKSLQWNTYLYFVVSESLLSSRKIAAFRDLIERDRKYARKFIISAAELEDLFREPLIAPPDTTPRVNVVTLWTQRLEESGLDRAILGDYELPERLALIESSSPPPKPVAHEPRVKVEPAQEIRSLELVRYRRFPHVRKFEFGRVNLICGQNGSGKTSLLEAIELYYCGKNKRNPDGLSPYELKVVRADGEDDVVTKRRREESFRDRNLAWYGQSDWKLDSLVLCFAQFNFLNTDAALGLIDFADHIKEDLSKLLLGADTARVWENIKDVQEAISFKLEELEPGMKLMGEELRNLEKLLRTFNRVQESDSLLARIEKMHAEQRWSLPSGGKEQVAGRLVAELQELVQLLGQMSELHRVASPVSVETLSQYCADAKTYLEEQGPELVQILSKQQDLQAATKPCEEASSLAKELFRLMQAGVPGRIADKQKEAKRVAVYADQLAGLDSTRLRSYMATSGLPKDISVSALCEQATRNRKSAEQELNDARVYYENYTKQSDQSLHLFLELHATATKILEHSEHQDDCPLCHTHFDQGLLKEKIEVQIREGLEQRGQEFFKKVKAKMKELQDAQALELAAQGLKQFCRKSRRSEDTSLSAALTYLQTAEKELGNARWKLDIVNRELKDLGEDQGLSEGRLHEVTSRLAELERAPKSLTLPAVERLVRSLSEELTRLANARQTAEKEAKATRRTIASGPFATHLNFLDAGTSSLEDDLSQVREQVTNVETHLMRLNRFAKTFPWPRSARLSQFAVVAESLHNMAVKFQEVLNTEKEKEAKRNETTQQIARLQQSFLELKPRVNRLKKARAILKGLQVRSFDKAMQSAYDELRKAIETIFARIHSPAEFQGLGKKLNTLIRKGDKKTAKLNEISTGQRAAFALSVFLAQNAQLSDGPPVILIDDPIVHIDDLNALSFLDYLREIALKRQRQIFFATANEKLAVLFERKFDFLGPQYFRRFDLTR